LNPLWQFIRWKNEKFSATNICFEGQITKKHVIQEFTICPFITAQGDRRPQLVYRGLKLMKQ
jgi:hypothetical protein